MQHPACRMREVAEPSADPVDRDIDTLEFLPIVDPERHAEPFRHYHRLAEMGLDEAFASVSAELNKIFI